MVRSNHPTEPRWEYGSWDRQNNPPRKLQAPQRSSKLQVSGSWLRAFRCSRHSSLGRVNEDVHLLADIDGQGAALKTIDNLKHPRIHPLGTVARQRFFRDDVGFESHEFQLRPDVLVASKVGGRTRAVAHAPGVIFIHVHT